MKKNNSSKRLFHVYIDDFEYNVLTKSYPNCRTLSDGFHFIINEYAKNYITYNYNYLMQLSRNLISNLYRLENMNYIRSDINDKIIELNSYIDEINHIYDNLSVQFDEIYIMFKSNSNSYKSFYELKEIRYNINNCINEYNNMIDSLSSLPRVIDVFNEYIESIKNYKFYSRNPYIIHY